MLNEKNINFYTLICMEFGVTGGIDIHEEINTGSIDEANGMNHHFVVSFGNLSELTFFICEK